MLRDAEIPVLRGFLKPSGEATEWKQNVFSAAGEILLIIYSKSSINQIVHFGVVIPSFVSIVATVTNKAGC